MVGVPIFGEFWQLLPHSDGGKMSPRDLKAMLQMIEPCNEVTIDHCKWRRQRQDGTRQEKSFVNQSQSERELYTLDYVWIIQATSEVKLM